jgi:predicted aminopeptidase
MTDMGRSSGRSIFVLLIFLPLSGCYVLQAARGQMNISASKQPIERVLANPATPERVKARLEYVVEARAFAINELGLPDNRSYKSYADLKRSYAVWNVFAAAEFSVEPKRWCFPIAGCVVYRGYFSENAAQRYAVRMESQGYDATVSGVPAYSTLGHFADPVLNTMMNWSDAQLAAMVFHELAHQIVYVSGDSNFNEAFATAVEEEGVTRWLEFKRQQVQLQQWKAQHERAQMFYGLLFAARERLKALYALSLPAAEKRDRKQQEFGRLKFEYWQLKQSWRGYSGYDAWFDRRLSNADLVPIATYETCIPGFKRLLAAVNGDLPRFYDEVKKLARLDAEARRRAVCS